MNYKYRFAVLNCTNAKKYDINEIVYYSNILNKKAIIIHFRKRM